jgi:glycosyltransferase involved in cell wall biosynthesis
MALPLSVIIPTRNEEYFLPRLLDGIVRQSQRPSEVIVADNHSSDRTREIAEEYGCIIVPGGDHPAIGRNSGARHATQPYLLFLDADVQIPSDFLEKNLNEFLSKDLGAASALSLPDSNKVIDKVGTALNNFYFLVSRRWLKNATGYCILVKADVHMCINGFDETIQIAEDQDYAIRASQVSKFDYLHSRKVIASLRRYEVEGKGRLVLKYLEIYFYTAFRNKLRKGRIPYSFTHEYGSPAVKFMDSTSRKDQEHS